MKAILALAVLASQPTYYEAKVTSFACNSMHEVHELREVRSDPKAFQMALLRKQFEGQCVIVLKGTLVEGSIEEADSSILRVNQRVDPPGYEAPREDFEIKAMEHQPSSDD